MAYLWTFNTRCMINVGTSYEPLPSFKGTIYEFVVGVSWTMYEPCLNHLRTMYEPCLCVTRTTCEPWAFDATAAGREGGYKDEFSGRGVRGPEAFGFLHPPSMNHVWTIYERGMHQL